MVRMRLNWRGPTCSGPRQAVPMQKRVLPASFAASAASSTGSSCISGVAFTPVSLDRRALCEQYPQSS